MTWRKWAMLTLALAIVAGTAGCLGGGDDDDDSAVPAVAAKLGTAVVTGKVVFKGKAPVEPIIQMGGDATCKAQHATAVSDPAVIVNKNGTLQNTFIYVKDGAGTYAAPKDPVALVQQGCMYHPHVFGIMVGQPLQIKNADPTLHNIHAMPVTNDGFNVGQPTQGMVSEKVFKKSEVMVKFKCDVHGWMNCYGGVVTNPFYAVTGDDGAFKLDKLPAGKYTVEAWHEKYGAQTFQIEVKDGEIKSQDVTFGQ